MSDPEFLLTAVSCPACLRSASLRSPSVSTGNAAPASGGIWIGTAAPAYSCRLVREYSLPSRAVVKLNERSMQWNCGRKFGVPNYRNSSRAGHHICLQTVMPYSASVMCVVGHNRAEVIPMNFVLAARRYRLIPGIHGHADRRHVACGTRKQDSRRR
jgi:hypothetical protein